MKNHVLTVLCLLLMSIQLLSQNATHNFIYFDHDSHELRQDQVAQLDELYHELNSHSDFEIQVIGHTDQDGSDDYNQVLAQKRAETVVNFLSNNGVTEDQIDILWLGEKQLADSDNTSHAKSKNRRVEIISTSYDFEDSEDIIASAHKVNTQHYSVDLSKKQVIDCNAGSTITIPPNSFVHEDGTAITDDRITVEIKEAFTYSDFIAEGLFTHSKGEILETGGMLFISATADGKPLKLIDGKSMDIVYPLQETKSDMELFYATEDENGNLDWEQAQQEFTTTNSTKEDVLHGLDLSDILNFDFGDMTVPTLDFEKLPARPKVRKLPHPPAKPQYGYPSDYENYEKKYKNYEAALAEYHIQKPLEEERLEKWNQEVTNRLSQVWEYKRNFKNFHAKVQALSGINKIKKYIGKKSTSDILAMLTANFDRGLSLKIIDRKLMQKAFGYETKKIIRERHINIQVTDYSNYKVIDIMGGLIKKSLNDIRNKAIELEYERSGNIDGRGFSSYVASINQLGWINCDRFRNYSRKCDLYVKDENNDTQYFLIFDDIKSMLRPQSNSNGVVFSDIPQEEDVKILGIKLVNKKPYIAIKNYTTESTNILEMDFQPGTLAMIKKELSKLENG